MDAVLRVDLQPALAALVVLEVLVDARRAEALLGAVVDGQVARDRDAVVLEGEVRRLVTWLGFGFGFG